MWTLGFNPSLETMETFTPKDWLERGHDIMGGKVDAKGFWHHAIKPGAFVWDPLLPASSVVMEELQKARIKQQDCLHIFVHNIKWHRIGRIKLLLILLESSKLKIQEAITSGAKNWWLVLHTYVIVCYTLSLHGSEGFLLQLDSLNQKTSAGGDRYVVVILLGKVKGKYHASPLPLWDQCENLSSEVDQIQMHMVA
jgi:hypothetical protein